MSDIMPIGEEPTPDEEPTAEALADELNLGIDLTDEERTAAEEMVAHLKEQFQFEDGETETPEEPESVEAEEPEEPATPTAEIPAGSTPEPPSTRGAVVIDGVEVPVEEAVAYLTKREVQREAAARQPAPEPPKPVEPPEWVDRDDPSDLARWNYMQKLELQQSQLLENQRRFAEQEQASKAMVAVDGALSTFRQLHPELTEDDVQTVRTHAAALEIIPGLQRTRNGTDAVLKALDIAYWDLPEFRAQATATPSPAAVKKAERAEKKEKLNALGGSSGSVPRTEAKPNLSSDRDARAAAAQWLKEQNIL